MSDEFVPYLSDYSSKFRMNFIFFDPCMATSEIQPLHLALPGNKKLGKPTAPRTTVPRSSIEPTRTSSRISRYSPKSKTQNLIENKEPEPETKTNSSANHSPKTTPQKTMERSLPARIPQTLPKETGAFKFDLSNVYMLPCLPSTTVSMRVQIENRGNGITSYVLYMPRDIDPEVRVRVDIKGSHRSSPITLYYNDQEVGYFAYNSNGTISVGITGLDPAVEAAAIMFNPSFSSPNTPKIFDLIIPALKKVNKRSHMYQVKLEETSGLLQLVSKMANEAIRLKTKIPSSSGDDKYDMKFNNHFDEYSINNFIIYHDSNPNRFMAEFSMINENNYFLKVAYPLSPIQGFFAAVSSLLPF